MNASAVAPTACLQRVRTLSLRAWKLALLGVMRSLAGLPLHRSCLRKVCPKSLSEKYQAASRLSIKRVIAI